MTRALAMAMVLSSGCGSGPVFEGLSERANVNGAEGEVHVCDAYQYGEDGDPIHVTGHGVDYQRPPCDLTAMNRPSTSPAMALHGADAPSEELTEVARLMVGEWRGSQTTPWDGTNDLRLTFFENGRYSGAAFGTSSILYYGDVCAYHREFWRIEHGARRLAFGQFASRNVPTCGGPSLELRRIQVDETTLRFEAWSRGTYGPISVQLERVVQEAP